MQTRRLIFVAAILSITAALSMFGPSHVATAEDSFAELAKYVHHDFCGAVVIHPHRIAQSPLGKSINVVGLIQAACRQAKLDPTRIMQFAAPSKIRRVTLLVDPFPGGNAGFDPAVVVEYEEDTSGAGLLRMLWPESRPSEEDERRFYLESDDDGTPIHGYVAGPKTVLIAPEPTLQRMLSKVRSPRNPLRTQLGAEFTKSEIVMLYVSQPALDKVLQMTGMTAAQLRSDSETDEIVKTMVLDVRSVSTHLQLKEAPSIRASIRCNSRGGAAEVHEMLIGMLQMLVAALGTDELRNQLKNDQAPAAVVELADSPAMKDLARATQLRRQGASVEVKLEVPATALDLARRSAAQLAGEPPRAVAPDAARPWTLAQEFKWNRGDTPLKTIHRDKGFVFLTGVQGALRAGAEVSLLPNPDGDWMLRGTDHAKLSGLAIAVPWFVEVEQPEVFKTWRKGEPAFPRLIHQRDGFCVLLKIGGAFNGLGEQFRLRVDDDGYWRLNARSQAPGTRVRVMVARLKEPGSFRGVVREHHWQNGQPPVRLIHSNEGIAFLSGLTGAFAGGAEYARVRRHADGYWYLEGQTRQGKLQAWAMSIELSDMIETEGTSAAATTGDSLANQPGEAAGVVPEAASRMRRWTSADGKFQITAELVRVAGKVVILKRASGNVIEVPLNQISRADQDFVNRALQRPATASAAKIEPSSQVRLRLVKSFQPQVKAVEALALSPNGGLLATAGGKEPATVWSTQDWSQRQSLAPSGGLGILSLAFSPSGSHLAVADNIVRVWDLQADEADEYEEDDDFMYQHVAFLGDERRLAAASIKPLRVWAPDQPTQSHVFDHPIDSAATSARGKYLAVGVGSLTKGGWRVEVFSTSPLEKKHSFLGHQKDIEALAFSADETLLASAGWESDIRLWNLKTGRLARTLSGHTSSVTGLCFAPSGSLLVSSGGALNGHFDRTLRLWDAASGKQLQSLEFDGKHAVSLAMSADGRLLAAGFSGGSVSVWSLGD